MNHSPRLLSPEELADLRARVLERGEVAVAEELGISRTAIMRALARLPQRRPTVHFLRAQLGGKGPQL